jgi:hypothetical protein
MKSTAGAIFGTLSKRFLAGAVDWRILFGQTVRVALSYFLRRLLRAAFIGG